MCCRPSSRVHNVPPIEEIPWRALPTMHWSVAKVAKLPETLPRPTSEGLATFVGRFNSTTEISSH